ncbi:helix-turn-helix domain-containing protein [Nocardiopsis sp. NPDC049922]|uniref:helix-turn-helix domain-containing protein n=1 Tax=Nocardiopsis sp. NPDC049922 TaxID=3155157 RepID=UPI0033EE4AD8
MDSDRKLMGSRVASLRKERGMSQKELAAELGRSESWVSQVERGVLPVDRLSMLQALADALRVSIQDIRGVEEGTPQGQEPEEYQNDLEGVRLVITGHPALTAVFGTQQLDKPVELSDLRERVDKAWKLVHAASYGELSEELSALIPALEGHVRRSSVEPEAYGLLARAYQAAASTLARQDEHDAAWVAADRAMQAAERAGLPLEVVAGVFRLAHTFLRIGRLDQAEHAAEGAVDALRTQWEAGTLPVEGKSLFGALCLVCAVISAREGDRAGTHRWIDRAREIAEEIGEDRNDFGTEFGPTNVGVHAVSTSVDLGDAGMALDLATGVDTSGLSPERQSRFLLDQARAYTQRRQVGEAVKALLNGEKLAPEQVRTHPLARQTIRDLIQLSRTPSADLVALAERAAVA